MDSLKLIITHQRSIATEQKGITESEIIANALFCSAGVALITALLVDIKRIQDCLSYKRGQIKPLFPLYEFLKQTTITGHILELGILSIFLSKKEKPIEMDPLVREAALNLEKKDYENIIDENDPILEVAKKAIDSVRPDKLKKELEDELQKNQKFIHNSRIGYSLKIGGLTGYLTFAFLLGGQMAYKLGPTFALKGSLLAALPFAALALFMEPRSEEEIKSKIYANKLLKIIEARG